MSRMRRSSLWFCLGALLAAAAIGSDRVAAQAPERELAVESKQTALSAYGGRVVWSSYDAAGKRFHLKTFDGVSTSVLPVAPRRVPFDVDLGPASDGRTVAVYSRCREDPRFVFDDPLLLSYREGSGCAVFRYDFARSREQRLNRVSAPKGSEFLPSIFGSTIAFARKRSDRGLGSFPRIVLRDDRGFRDLGRGVRGGEPTAIDLARGRVGFRWKMQRQPCDRGQDLDLDLGPMLAEIWSVDLRRDRLKRLRVSCSSSARLPLLLNGPVLAEDRLFFIETPQSFEDRLFSVGADGRARREPADVRRVRNFARDTSAMYVGISDGDRGFRILQRPLP